MRIANADLPPYWNGEELHVQSGLPLGITAEVNFDETTRQLSPGDRLTYVSDGVAEARNASGELYGFERTQTLSGQSAQAIAETARKFGQEDDITVLAVTYGCHSARTRLRQAELRDWIRVVVGLRANRTLLHRGGGIIVHRECRLWQHSIATSRQLRIGREVTENPVLSALQGNNDPLPYRLRFRGTDH